MGNKVTDLLSDTDLRTQLNALTTELNQTKYRLTSVSEYRDQLATELRNVRELFQKDVALIGEKFKASATDDDWTEAYEGVVSAINRRLTYELPELRSDYSVTVNVKLEMTVSARDDDDARELAYSAVRDIESRIDDGSWGDDDLSVTSRPEPSNYYEIEKA